MPTTSVAKLLIVDDEAAQMTALCDTLTDQGYGTTGFASASEALAALREQEFDLVLTDLMMPEMDGIVLLRAALEIDPNLVGIVMTGHGAIDTAVEAMKAGALDYILKPFKLSAILPVLSRALSVRRLRMENIQLREAVGIYELSMASAFALDFSTVLNKVADAAFQQSQAREMSILLPTRDGKELRVAVARGQNADQLQGKRVPFSDALSGWVAHSQELLSKPPDALIDVQSAFAPPLRDLTTGISMPMLTGGRLVGILNFTSARPQRPFTLGQVKALNILASAGASALEAASLLEQLQAAEQRYRRLAENAPDIVFRYELHPRRCFSYVNPVVTTITGYSTEEHYADPDLNVKIVHPDDRPVLEQVLRGGSPSGSTTTLRWVHKNGTVIWIEQRNVPVRNPAGQLVAIEGIARDVTERKRAEDALRQSERSLAQAQRLANLGSWDWDFGSGKIFWSDQMYRIFGLNPAHFHPTYDSMMSRVHPEDRGLFRQWIEQSVAEKSSRSLEYRILSSDGQTVRHVVAQSELVTNEDNVPVRMTGTMQDITERRETEEALRQSEEQLRHAQRMEAVGRLAGGIAHDFNNLLTAIIGYSDILLNSQVESDSARADISEIKKAGERAATLTSQLLAFSRKQVLQPRVLDLNEVVTDMEEMLRRLIGEDIELVIGPDPALGRVKADPGGIEQIVLNLAVNARDAMPDGGRLSIETANVDLDASYARRHVAVQPGPYVMLAVSDTGMGMTLETQARIFEPFFTTKEQGKGTGLGLSTIYGIVKQSGGNIWVYSELGRGTTFKIYLPRVEEALTPAETVAPEALVRQGSETILLVEDEEVIRKLVSVILQEHGYTVLVARNGLEALKISEEHPDPIHLVLTDVVMPWMTVRELTQGLAKMRPQTHVLYASGYTDNAIVHHGVLDEGMHFIQKPFTAVALLRKIRELLDQP